MATTISFRLDDLQQEKLLEVARQRGSIENVNLFSKEIIVSVLEGQWEVVKITEKTDDAVVRLQAQNDLLTAQNEKLLERLAKETQQSALNGFDTKHQNVSKLVQQALEEERHKNYVKELEEDNKDLQQDLNNALGQLKDLQAQADQEAKMQRWVETGGKVIESIHKVNPRVAEKITNGLGGFFGLPASEAPALEAAEIQLSPEEQQCLLIGSGIRKSFGERTQAAINVLKFYAKHQESMQKFLLSKPVTAYLQTLQQQP